jgi:translation initiation factor 2-alpha kinase 4
MAWNASGAWKIPVTNNPNVNESNFPGLKPLASPEATTKVEYAELQENELLALEAIYGEDFVNLTAEQGAWKVSSPNFMCYFDRSQMTLDHLMRSTEI